MTSNEDIERKRKENVQKHSEGTNLNVGIIARCNKKKSVGEERKSKNPYRQYLENSERPWFGVKTEDGECERRKCYGK